MLSYKDGGIVINIYKMMCLCNIQMSEYYTPPPRYTQHAQPSQHAQPFQHAQPPLRHAQPPQRRHAQQRHPHMVIINTNEIQCTHQDMRCCGLCYFCCSTNNIQCCPVNLNHYCLSGYIQTTTTVNKDDGCCTCFCLPVKLPLTFICCLGSVVNECMNSCCNSINMNYLF